LLEDEALRTRFAELTDEAVDRWTRYRERLAFSFKDPQPEALDVANSTACWAARPGSTSGMCACAVSAPARCAAGREHGARSAICCSGC
jgi:hypothetical protein